MEDVLEVYRRDFAEDEVLVCMDETSKQHVKETRTPVPTRPGETAKYDYEYERNGVSNLPGRIGRGVMDMVTASLYEAFDPAEARRIAERLEIHFTPSTAVG